MHSAKYYTTIFYNADSGEEEEFLLTHSFLKDDEELIHIADICEDNEIPIIEKSIEQFFMLRYFNESQIDQLKLDFIKQSFLNKLFDNKDANGKNMGIIYKGKNARMSPMFDFDFCMGNTRVKGCNIEKTVNGKKDLLSFIDFYKENQSFMQWIQNYILPLEIKKEDIKKNNNLRPITRTNNKYIQQ